MPNLLNHRIGSQWDRCGVHYVEPSKRSSRSREPKRPWSVRSTTMPKAATAMAAFAKELTAEVIRPRTH